MLVSKLDDFTYRSDDLCDYINSYVDVKYDPHDMATIYVFRDGKQVCEAYSQELYGICIRERSGAKGSQGTS